MLFRPSINSSIYIDGKEYFFTEHPAAKGMPYGQTGRRATVYQVRNGNVFHALKVFTKAFRTEQTEVSARRIQAYANLPGLQVCSRVVITRQNNGTAVGQFPDLEYAVLMTWVKGQTWQEILLAHQPLTRTQSLEIAHNFAQILAAMEERQIAHCDLSGPNILLDDTTVNLVDVEDLYAPTLEKPEKLPGGSTGYGHKTSAQGLWNADADRFAGAILLAEILGWHDERARRVAVGEQYFDAAELQSPCDRYQILLSALKAHHGAFADLFAQAWFSKSLADCPSISEWRTFFTKLNQVKPVELPALSGAALSLYESAQESAQAGNWQELERQARALQVLMPGFTPADSLLEQAHTGAEQQAQDALEKEHAALQEEHEQILCRMADLQTRLDAISTRLAQLAATIVRPEPVPPKVVSTSPDVTPSGQAPGGHPIYCFGRYSSLYEQFPASLGMEFAKVPAGAFLMGSTQKENVLAEWLMPNAGSDEKPQHTVQITYDYYMARYPVTNAQYAEFCQAAGLKHPLKDWQNYTNHPVTDVSWQDADEYIQWLANLFANTALPVNLVLRLPSEAEWEKASRGTDRRLYPWGSQHPDATLCNFSYHENGTTGVGKYSPGGDSPYGCADMIGNVWEWVNDRYSRSYYKNSPPSNPQGPAEGRYRVLRGGSWIDTEYYSLRSAIRNSFAPGIRRAYIGFRCALSTP